MASSATSPFSSSQRVVPSDQDPVAEPWSLSSSSMSRVTFHSNSTSLEVGPDAQDEAPNDVDDFGFLDVEPSVSESDAEALSGMDLDPAFQETDVEDRPSEPDPISDEAAVSAPRVGASRSRVLVLLLVVALMGLVAAAWYGVVEIPWLSSGLPE